MAATVLLSTPPVPFADDPRRHLVAAGLAVVDHHTGAPAAVDFGPVAVAVVVVGEAPDAAVLQTRRWRAELGERFVPVLWLSPPGHAVAGLDAGADAVLPQPADPAVLVAQVRALVRAQAVSGRAAARANEARLLGDQLRKALAQLDREQDMADRVRAAMRPRSLPVAGGLRFHVRGRARPRGADFHDVRRLDEHHVGFAVGAAAGLLGAFVQQSVVMKEISELSYRVVPPDEVLANANRSLLALGADDMPLVAMLAGVVNVTTGAVSVARAGLPAPVHVPAGGEPAVWSAPGPYLGTAETTYHARGGVLAPGDRLLVGTGDLFGAASRHRAASGAEFADAVARELLSGARHADDFTLLCVEMR